MILEIKGDRSPFEVKVFYEWPSENKKVRIIEIEDKIQGKVLSVGGREDVSPEEPIEENIPMVVSSVYLEEKLIKTNKKPCR